MFISATDAIKAQKLTTSLNKTPPPLGDQLVRLVPWCCSTASGYSNGPEEWVQLCGIFDVILTVHRR